MFQFDRSCNMSFIATNTLERPNQYGKNFNIQRANHPLVLTLRGKSVETTDPVSFKLPGKGCQALISPENDQLVVAINDEDAYQVVVCNYETGKLAHTFKCGNYIWDFNVKDDTLFVKLANAWHILAWDLKTGNPVNLPEDWKSVDKMYFGEKLIAHNNFGDPNASKVVNRPISIIISEPHTFKALNTIDTGFFNIFDMAIQDNKLWVLGIDENCTYSRSRDYVNYASVIRYDNPLDPNCDKRKATFVYDVNRLATNVLKIEHGTLYNSTWFPSMNYLWDINTLSPMFETKSIKNNTNNSVLTQVMDDIAVIFDDKGMQFLQKKENQFLPVKSIEWEKNESGTSLELFKYENTSILAEGCNNGIVRLRDLQTYQVTCVLNPPENMESVAHTKYQNNKLLTHYAQPSSEGTVAIIWDLHQQKELLKIKIEDLPKDYNSYTDNFFIINEDLVVRCNDQVKVYKGVFL